MESANGDETSLDSLDLSPSVHYAHCPHCVPGIFNSRDDELEEFEGPVRDGIGGHIGENKGPVEDDKAEGDEGFQEADMEERSGEDVESEDVTFHLLPIRLCICRLGESPQTHLFYEDLTTYIRECLHEANLLTELMKQLDKHHLSSYQDFLAETIATSTGDLLRLARRWVTKLACATGVFPRTLFTKGIRSESAHPVACGAYADIHRGFVGEAPVALKVLRHFPKERSFHKEFCLEALIWHQLDHPHILPLLGVCLDTFRPRLCLVSPWMKHGTILEYLSERPKVVPTKLLYEVSLGLHYLHTLDPPLIHGDIKGVNLLIDDNGEVRISDFGLISVSETYNQTFATAMDTRSPDNGGTLRWMAPELHESNEVKSRKTDIYAFGMMMLEVFTGQVPYCHLQKEYHVFMAVRNGELPERPEVKSTRGLTDSVWSLMQGCWHKRDQRPDSEQLIDKLKSFILPDQPTNDEAPAYIKDEISTEIPTQSKTPRKRKSNYHSSHSSGTFKKQKLMRVKPIQRLNGALQPPSFEAPVEASASDTARRGSNLSGGPARLSNVIKSAAELYHANFNGINEGISSLGELKSTPEVIGKLSEHKEIHNLIEEGNHGPVASHTDQAIMQQLLTALQNHPQSWPFLQPISSEEVTDYYDVVKKPMDFNTMEHKLVCGSYQTITDFVNDARLIFSNCHLYNAEGTVFTKSAIKLERFLDDQLSLLAPHATNTIP